MFPFVVFGFLILTCCHCSDVYVSGMEKRLSFDNNLPQTSACYINSVDNTSPVHCVSLCLTRREVCKGVVFNRERRTCKLLQCKPNEYPTGDVYETGKWDLFWKTKGVCKQGWVKHQEHCYLFNQTGDTWTNAKGVCEKNGGSLASIRSLEENSWIVDTFLPPWDSTQCSSWWLCCEYWIGGNDIAEEGTYVWASDNSTLGFSNWHPLEPDNYNLGTMDQDCVSICQDESWADHFCDGNYPYICKAPTM